MREDKMVANFQIFLCTHHGLCFTARRTFCLTFAPSFSICLLPITHVGSVAADRAQTPEEDRQTVCIDGKNDNEIVFEPRRDKKQPIRPSFGHVHPQSGEVESNYDMSSSPHGIALIINNEESSKGKDRQSQRIDEMNLIQTFRYLGYIVEVHRDRSASQIRDIFDEVSTRDHSKYDSFISCLLSHGEDGMIYGSDGDKVDIADIAKKLDGESCKLLHNKPKMFFVQVCREGRRIASDSPKPRFMINPVKILNATDFFVGFATPCYLEHSSRYVSELCRALCTHATYTELHDMVQGVHGKIRMVSAGITTGLWILLLTRHFIGSLVCCRLFNWLL